MKLILIKRGALLCLAHFCCIAQTNSLNGSWKADPSTKKYDGANFLVATDTTGYSVAVPGLAVDKTVCDGQAKSDPDGSTYTCRKTESGFMVEQSKPEVRAAISTSPDGNTLTYRFDGVASDGVHFTLVQTSKRVSGGPGIAGEWHPVGLDMSPDAGIVMIQITGDTVLFKESNDPQPSSYKLDGTEVKRPFEQTGSATLVNPHTLKISYRSKSKVNRENTFLVSDDGKTLTETDAIPGPNPSTYSVAYHKLDDRSAAGGP